MKSPRHVNSSHIIKCTLPVMITIAINIESALAASTYINEKSLTKGTVVFHIKGFGSNKGKAMCAIFTKNKWLVKGQGHGNTSRIENKKATCTFKDIPLGEYGIAAFHDKDNDGELNKFLGIPTESGCFSRNMDATFGPPAFKDTKFSHDNPLTIQRCTLD